MFCSFDKKFFSSFTVNATPQFLRVYWKKKKISLLIFSLPNAHIIWKTVICSQIWEQLVFLCGNATTSSTKATKNIFAISYIKTLLQKDFNRKANQTPLK